MLRILLVLFVSTSFISATTAQKWKTIHGEGDVVKKELNIASFDGVSLGFHGDVYITQGSAQKVEVEAQQNIIDNIKREVKDGVWRVNFENNVKNAKPVNVYITIPELTEASVSGSGNLISTGKFTGIDHLATYISGSGNVKLEVDAQSVDGAISGSGKIELKGMSGSMDMSISGSGSINAREFEVENIEVSISGSGNANVYAKESLEASISGSGNIRYRGEAAKVKARVSGSGNVREMN
jgi:putative autotransporter adhesin-like protein